MTETDHNGEWAWAAALAATVTVALVLGWVGFIASDDALYFRGAELWLERPPFAGDDHWTTRFPVVLTFAAAIALAATGVAAFSVHSLFWYAVTIATVWLVAREVGGQRAAWLAAVLTAVTPVVAFNASIVNCDLAEASFLLLGALLLSRAGTRGAMIGAGMTFGLALLSRETAVLALTGMLALFALGRPIARGRLFVAGIGIVAVLAAEMAFQWATTGDPLHRYTLAYSHDSTLDRAAGLEGNLLVHPAIDPLLALLVNNEFGLLFWLAPLAVWFVRDRLGSPLGAILAALAVANIVLVSALSTKLVLNPRYFTIAALVAIVFVAVWLARLSWRWQALVGGGTAIVALALLSLGNAHPQWPVEALVKAAQAHPDRRVIAEADVVARAELSLRFAGVTNASGGPAQPGDLALGAEAPDGATVLATYPTPPRPAGAILERLGLELLLPHTVAQRLTQT